MAICCPAKAAKRSGLTQALGRRSFSMNENALNAIAIALELGIPVFLAVACWLNPSRRRLYLPALIAISPFLLLFLLVTINHLPNIGQYDFAFGAMWIMCFIPYMVFLIVGFAFGLLRGQDNARQ